MNTRSLCVWAFFFMIATASPMAGAAGDPNAGQITWNSRCVSCHTEPLTTSTVAKASYSPSVISNAIATVVMMSAIQLTAADLDNLAAFIGNAVNQVPDYQGLWWAAPAGSESGWGINLNHQYNVIFATWFTYDATGKGMWLVMTATPGAGVNATTYTGSLFTTTGPAFNAQPFNPNLIKATQVGTGSLTFTNLNTATFAYTVNGIAQNKTITREVFGPLPTCLFVGAPDYSTTTNFQDLWWATPAGSESGWGINLTHQGDTIFASWFTYDLDGSAMWLVAITQKTGANAYTGGLFRTTGPAFSSVPFDPQKVGVTQVGTATFTFADGNNASFAYSVSGVAGLKQIIREQFRAVGNYCQ